MTNISVTCIQALHSPFLYPLSLEDFGQFVESSKALGDVISLGSVVDSHLGLSVGQGSLKEKRDDTTEQRSFFFIYNLLLLVLFTGKCCCFTFELMTLFVNRVFRILALWFISQIHEKAILVNYEE